MASQFAAQGYTQRLLGVTVTNVGRFPVSIDGALARTEAGFGYQRAGWTINPEQGHRLEPFSTATWWVDLEPLEDVVGMTARTDDKWNRPQHVRMVVTRSGGKDLTTKESVVIAP